MRRFIVELGTGSDLHGGNVTTAATRAVRDAISRSCLCGLFEIAGLKDPRDMQVRVHIASPFPDRVDRDAVAAELPFGRVSVEVTEGRHADRRAARRQPRRRQPHRRRGRGDHRFDRLSGPVPAPPVSAAGSMARGDGSVNSLIASHRRLTR